MNRKPAKQYDDNEGAWVEQANCRGSSKLFVETISNLGSLEVRSRRDMVAKAICNLCPVKEQCLNFALLHHEFGVWGGTNESDRAAMRAKD
jgi:WhiB family transcriptional regulator, redox-sensing transcriptional regulator